jgi:hypothetical protein
VLEVRGGIKAQQAPRKPWQWKVASAYVLSDLLQYPTQKGLQRCCHQLLSYKWKEHQEKKEFGQALQFRQCRLGMVGEYRALLKYQDVPNKAGREEEQINGPHLLLWFYSPIQLVGHRGAGD